MKHILFAFLLLSFFSVGAQSTGSLKGMIMDTVTKEPVPFATVMLTDSAHNHVAFTDVNGVYQLDGIIPGTYVLKFTVFGLKPLEHSVSITAGIITEFSLGLHIIQHYSGCPVMPEYRPYNPDDNPSSTIIYRDDIRHMAVPR